VSGRLYVFESDGVSIFDTPITSPVLAVKLSTGVTRRVCSLAAKGLLAWALSGCAALAAPATAPAVERARDGTTLRR
jgi:hypothetical protein